MAKFIMFMGIPCSGKSQRARALAHELEAEYLSSDVLRGELYGDETKQDNPAEIFNIMYQRADESLAQGKDVVFDATNVNQKKRISGLKNIRHATEKEIVYMATPLDVCLTRAKERERQVPNHVIGRMFMQLQVPHYNEGWDKITIEHRWPSDIKADELRQTAETVIKSQIPYAELFQFLSSRNEFARTIDLAQDTPYHTLSVSRHTFYVYEELRNQTDDIALLWSALLHDIGKPVVKNFAEGSRYANFKNHEYVGAQMAVEFLHWLGYDAEFIMEVANIVSYHMRPFSFPIGEKEQKAIDKFKNLVGEKMYNKIMILHEADKRAK